MLPISPDEIQAPSRNDFRAIRERLYQPPAARDLAARSVPADPPIVVPIRTSEERLAAMVASARARFAPIAIPVKCGISVRQILVEVGLKHGFMSADIVGSSRIRPLIHARQEAIYRLAMERSMSYPEIGRAIGGRDHSTALHGIHAHCKRHGLPLPERTVGGVRT